MKFSERERVNDGGALGRQSLYCWCKQTTILPEI